MARGDQTTATVHGYLTSVTLRIWSQEWMWAGHQLVWKNHQPMYGAMSGISMEPAEPFCLPWRTSGIISMRRWVCMITSTCPRFWRAAVLSHLKTRLTSILKCGKHSITALAHIPVSHASKMRATGNGTWNRSKCVCPSHSSQWTVYLIQAHADARFFCSNQRKTIVIWGHPPWPRVLMSVSVMKGMTSITNPCLPSRFCLLFRIRQVSLVSLVLFLNSVLVYLYTVCEDRSTFKKKKEYAWQCDGLDFWKRSLKSFAELICSLLKKKKKKNSLSFFSFYSVDKAARVFLRCLCDLYKNWILGWHSHIWSPNTGIFSAAYKYLWNLPYVRFCSYVF